MTPVAKLIVSLAVTGGIYLGIRHGATALHPAVPKDMPVSATFVQSGYNLARNEPLGDWVACQPDTADNTDRCRVTDSRGTVIFEGQFLPLAGSRPLPATQLKVAKDENPTHLWVQGPAEHAPVPVIRLDNGQLLVPAADSDALADRWARDPDELNRIEGL